MGIIETVIIGASVISSVGICALAWYYSTVQAAVQSAIIQQQGIDRRFAASAGGTNGTSPSPFGKDAEWWMPIVHELSKNPEVVKLALNYAPGILEKLNVKTGVN